MPHPFGSVGKGRAANLISLSTKQKQHLSRELWVVHALGTEFKWAGQELVCVWRQREITFLPNLPEQLTVKRLDVRK